MQYATCAGIVAAWLTLAASVFALSEGWTPAQAFFYAVDTGMSIGFGAVSERRLITKLFTIGHVLLGASCVGGAIALFAESAVNASPAIAAAQYSIASVNSAFSRADADGSGAISPIEFSAALASLGVNLDEERQAEAFRAFDRDGDGRISLAEYTRALTPRLTAAHGSVDQALADAVTRHSWRPAAAMYGRLADGAIASQVSHRLCEGLSL